VRPADRAAVRPAGLRLGNQVVVGYTCWHQWEKRSLTLGERKPAMLSLLLAGVLAAPAPPVPGPPKGPAPLLLTVRVKENEGLIVAERTEPPTEWQQRVQKINVGGQNANVGVLVGKVKNAAFSKKLVLVTTVTHRLVLKGAKARYADGRKIDSDDLPKLLAKPRLAVISSDGKAVDPAYLHLLKRDTLVIVAKTAPEWPPRPTPPVS